MNSPSTLPQQCAHISGRFSSCLTNFNNCCACNDKRPINSGFVTLRNPRAYSVVDTTKYFFRWASYCKNCQDYWDGVLREAGNWQVGFPESLISLMTNPQRLQGLHRTQLSSGSREPTIASSSSAGRETAKPYPFQSALQDRIARNDPPAGPAAASSSRAGGEDAVSGDHPRPYPMTWGELLRNPNHRRPGIASGNLESGGPATPKESRRGRKKRKGKGVPSSSKKKGSAARPVLTREEAGYQRPDPSQQHDPDDEESITALNLRFLGLMESSDEELEPEPEPHIAYGFNFDFDFGGGSDDNDQDSEWESWPGMVVVPTPSLGPTNTQGPSPLSPEIRQLAEDSSVMLELLSKADPFDTTAIDNDYKQIIDDAFANIRKMRKQYRLAIMAKSGTVGVTGMPPPSADEDTKVESACVVCCDEVADTVLLPCNHLILCMGCSDMMGIKERGVMGAEAVPCPICRTLVADRIKIFRA